MKWNREGVFGGAIFAPDADGAAASPAPVVETLSTETATSPTPAPTSTPAEAAPAQRGESDFDIPDDIDDDVVVIPPSTEAKPPPSKPVGATAETQPPTDAPAAGVTPAVQPPAPAQPSSEAQPPPSQQPTPPAAGTETPKPEAVAEAAKQLDPSTPEGFMQGLAQHKEALIANLAATRFALSQAEVDEITNDPATVIPKLMAKVFIEAMGTIQRQIQTFVPPIIQRQQAAASAAMSAEQKFYATHPAIPRTAEADKEVDRIARRYRAAFPDATLDQTIADVGMLAMQSLKIAPAAPAPKNGNGQRPAKPAPPAFQPAVGNANPGATASAEDEWAGFDLPS